VDHRKGNYDLDGFPDLDCYEYQLDEKASLADVVERLQGFFRKFTMTVELNSSRRIRKTFQRLERDLCDILMRYKSAHIDPPLIDLEQIATLENHLVDLKNRKLNMFSIFDEVLTVVQDILKRIEPSADFEIKRKINILGHYITTETLKSRFKSNMKNLLELKRNRPRKRINSPGLHQI